MLLQVLALALVLATNSTGQHKLSHSSRNSTTAPVGAVLAVPPERDARLPNFQFERRFEAAASTIQNHFGFVILNSET